LNHVLTLSTFINRAATTLRAKGVVKRGKPSPAVAPETPSASVPEVAETEPSPPRDDQFYDADANVNITTEDAEETPTQGGESDVQMDLGSSVAEDEGPMPSPTKVAEAPAKDAQVESTSAPSQETEVIKEKSPEPTTEAAEEHKAADDSTALATTTEPAKAAEAPAAPKPKLHAAPGTAMVKAASSQQMTTPPGTSSMPRSINPESFGFAELEVASSSMLKMVQNSVLSIRAATKVILLITFYLVTFAYSYTHVAPEA
jgi:hypothetical protein